jgi:hypothetical protein
MATMQHDIPVASVNAPRRRDEILPEHEARWPDTEAVRALITERYDGSSSTAHEIGLELVTVKHGCYPGWRVEQIAAAMGIAEEKRDALIERSRAAEADEKAERQRRQGDMTPTTRAHGGDGEGRPMWTPVRNVVEAQARVMSENGDPTRAMLREDLAVIAKEQSPCVQCGKRFDMWRRYKGNLTPTKLCHECSTARASQARWGAKGSALGDEAATPAATPGTDSEMVSGSVSGTATQPGWRDVLPPPRPPRPTEPLPVVEVAANFLNDGPESFGDLPGSGAVFELLDLLPVDGRWSPLRRIKWLTAFTATLDLLIEEEVGA